WSTEGHMLLTYDANLEECVRCQPQHESDQKFGDDADDVNRRSERHDAEDQDQCVGLNVQVVVQAGQRCRGNQQSHRVVEIISADDAALLFVLGTLLQVGIQGHDEDSAGDSQQGQYYYRRCIGIVRCIEQHA